MHLYIHIVGDSGLAEGNKNILNEFYLEGLRKHKLNLKTTHPDSGFDLFCPRDLTIPPNETSFIDLGIRCAALNNFSDGGDGGIRGLAFYVYPRSSLSKTPLRLANSVGIIDSGYRGNILAAVDNIRDKPFQVRRGTRLFQICAPDLSPLSVELVNSLDKTVRGAGGFGSTGQ
jgi:dUTP pyrophosphatase